MKTMSPGRAMMGQQPARGAQRVQLVSQRPLGVGPRGRGRGNKMQPVTLQGMNSPGMGGINPGMGRAGPQGLRGRGQMTRGGLKQPSLEWVGPGVGIRGGRAQPMLQGAGGGMMRGGTQGQMRGAGGRMRGGPVMQQTQARSSFFYVFIFVRCPCCIRFQQKLLNISIN